MSDLTSSDIPPPENWQDFEKLCRDLWSRRWNDPEAKMHGRSGQKQHGVDVYGRPGQGPEWAGVQCKLKSQMSGARLTKKQIETEADKAEKFEPRISKLVVATTAGRDAAVQKAEREITEARLASGSFPVSVWAWEDIRTALAEHPDLVAKYFPSFGLSLDVPENAVRDEYLRALWDRCLPVPMLGVGRGGQEDVPLLAVYTVLDVTTEIHAGEQKQRHGPVGEELGGLGLRGNRDYLDQVRARVRREAERLEEKRRLRSESVESYSRRLTALEAAAAARRLVLLGPPGSGKSTFARHLVLCLAGEALGHEEADLARLEPAAAAEDGERVWPHGAVLPILIELKNFVRSDVFPGEREAGRADHLFRYLASEESPAVAELARQAFAVRGGGLLVLDGLDETPAAEQCRGRLRQVVTSFCRRYRRARVLVTSRPYAYEPGSPWRLDSAGFEETALAPFDAVQARAYVDGWYQHLAARGQVGADQAPRRAAALWREVSATDYLKPLAERPLILTMMADLHASAGGRLRGGRAGIYEQSVELLLDRWNEIRDVEEGYSVGELLGMHVEQLRQALERLAYEVHRERGVGEGGTAAEISDGELLRALGRERSREDWVDERRVVDYLHQRSGILFGESPTVYRFPHRSYQEYLAACYLTRKRFPDLLLEDVRSDPALWREVVLLAAGKVSPTPFMVWALLEGLVPVEPGPETRLDDPAFLPALYAALAIRENGLWKEVQPQDAPKLERVRQWFQRSLEIGALSPVDRAAGGRVLALLGDRRRGVGLRDDGLPDVDWVEIPGGRFTIGPDASTWRAKPSPAAEVEVGSFQIARYPVTSAQYQIFIQDGGYSAKWKHCWTDAGWKWKGDRQAPDEPREEFLLANHPRVVTWFEASAYCRWLSDKLDHEVRLPTEAEWERAGRGGDGRAYPWGDKFDSANCNVHETGIGTTCAVGSFPSGATLEGVLDMSGNVREWCSTKWRDSYVKPADEDPEGKASRVLRGGSFAGGLILARCAYRYSISPRVASLSYGFRVAAPI